MKFIEYKPNPADVRVAIFEALWPIRKCQRRKVIEEIGCSGYYFGGGINVTLLIGTIIEIFDFDPDCQDYIIIYALPKGMTLTVSKNNILAKTEPAGDQVIIEIPNK